MIRNDLRYCQFDKDFLAIESFYASFSQINTQSEFETFLISLDSNSFPKRVMIANPDLILHTTSSCKKLEYKVRVMKIFHSVYSNQSVSFVNEETGGVEVKEFDPPHIKPNKKANLFGKIFCYFKL